MTTLPRPQSFFKPWQSIVLIGLFFLSALGIRIFDLTDPPNDFYMVRQFRSLTIARGMYYSTLDSAEDWQQHFAVAQENSEGLIEPPILENLVALTYRIIGEHLWVGRLYSILFWLAGGIAILLLAKDLEMKNGGLLCLAYYLLVPFGVIASRAIMPDPLMVALMVWSIWALHRWEVHRTWKWTIVAGLLTGLAILVKSVAVFPLLGASVALILSRASFRKMFQNWQTWAVAGIAAIPTIIFYIYGFLADNSLSGQFSLRFFPEMLRDPSFYGRWLFLMAGITGFLTLFLSWTGILLFRTRAARSMVIGLWIGYIIFGLFFPYHFLTHEYYHLPVLPIVAIGLIPTTDLFFDFLEHHREVIVGEKKQKTGWIHLFLAGLILFGMAMQMWGVRNTLVRDNYRNEPIYWQELGDVIGHDLRIIQLSGDYGSRLAFYGWIGGRQWSTVADMSLRELAGQEQPDFANEFARKTRGVDLFVITSMPELENQPDLKEFLASHFPVFTDGDGYLIYDLRH